MFCPKCASQNIDGASFCRSCGANLSLVSQAMSGQLPQPVLEEDDSGSCITRRGKRPVSLDQAFKNAFMGVAFLIIAIALSFSIGRGWWFWMLIPAFSMLATGLAQYIKIKEREKRAVQGRGFVQPQFQSPPPRDVFPVRNTGELFSPPPSVTEGTTRHLGAEVPTRHFGNEVSK